MELRLNVPPQPRVVDESIASALRAVAGRNDFSDRLTYGTTAGRVDDREAGAEWLRPRLGKVERDRVVVGAGGASVLVALATTFTRPGDVVVTESLTYPGIRAVCRHFGMALAGVEMDDEGLVPSALAETCERVRPKVLFCTPTLQNPTTATMSTQRRHDIAAIADAFDLTIIEDDAYGLLPLAGPPPLAAFAPDRTFYIASVSKCLSPSLRIAFCVGPEHLRAQMTEGVRVVTFLASQLMAAVATQLIESGSAQQILDAIRDETAARQSIASQAMVGQVIATHPHSPHLWLTLPGVWRIPELGSYLRDNGVNAKGDGFAVTDEHPNALRIGIGAPPTIEALTRSLAFLSTALLEQHLRIR